MRTNLKSEGMHQFERQISELEKRVDRGEMPEPREAFIAVWRNTVPRMTSSERRSVTRLILNAHRVAELVSPSYLPHASNEVIDAGADQN